VAQRLVTRNGGRGTTLGQIAQEAGVTTAGLLHHFESKEQLLHAVLDARDADDLARVDIKGDVIEQLEKVTDRFQRSPELMRLFTVSAATETRSIVAECIRRGQQTGAYRADLAGRHRGGRGRDQALG
jgi:AcrR family transcriptional regulator